jgi:hypothetical protein
LCFEHGSFKYTPREVYWKQNDKTEHMPGHIK